MLQVDRAYHLLKERKEKWEIREDQGIERIHLIAKHEINYVNYFNFFIMSGEIS